MPAHASSKAQKRKPPGHKDDKACLAGFDSRANWEPEVTTVFVGGLRKSTTEDKVIGHFSKFGQARAGPGMAPGGRARHHFKNYTQEMANSCQVDNVDIKRLPDGTSRGFAFVKFVDRESVDKVG